MKVRCSNIESAGAGSIGGVQETWVTFCATNFLLPMFDGQLGECREAHAASSHRCKFHVAHDCKTRPGNLRVLPPCQGR